MPRFKVVVSDQVFPSTDIERALLAEIDAELVVSDGTPEGLLRVGRDADAILTTYMPIGAELLASLARCRIVARYGIGVDNIDVAAACAAGIVVTNVPDYSTEEVAVHTMALLLAAVRRLPRAMTAATTEPWTIEGIRPIARLSEQTVGVVGLGRIGRRVISLLRPFEVRILGYDPFAGGAIEGVEMVDTLEALLAASDIVTLHLPLTAATRGLIGAAQLARMRPGALLVNTSRGGLVPTDDLVAALDAGAIGGAALDVLEHEPADAPRLAARREVILTPHMAYYSESALRESQRKAATQIIKVLRGEEPDYPVGC